MQQQFASRLVIIVDNLQQQQVDKSEIHITSTSSKNGIYNYLYYITINCCGVSYSVCCFSFLFITVFIFFIFIDIIIILIILYLFVVVFVVFFFVFPSCCFCCCCSLLCVVSSGANCGKRTKRQLNNHPHPASHS